MYTFFCFSFSDGYEFGFASADSQGSEKGSDSEFNPGGGAQRRKPRPSNYIRMTSRKRGAISYKESSGSELMDSDMVVERGGGEGVPAEEEDNREGIEKVLMERKGRVGGGCVHPSMVYILQKL